MGSLELRRIRSKALVGLASGAVLAVLAACAPVPEARPAPGGPAPLWVGDVETGDLSQFAETPWNTVEADEPTVVADPDLVRDGRFAVEMTIPGAADIGDEGTRSEIEPDVDRIQPGDEFYYGFSVLLDPDFPTDAEWQVIVQWKNEGEGSPPLSLSVEEDQFILSGGASHPDGPRTFDIPLAPAVPGEWTDWTVHIVFSPDPDEGYIEIWQGDDLVLPQYAPETGTMYPAEDGASSYLKMGYYRASDIERPGSVYFDNWKIGDSRAAVARSAS